MMITMVLFIKAMIIEIVIDRCCAELKWIFSVAMEDFSTID